MVNLENMFKNVKNNGEFNLGFGQKPLPTMPPNRQPVDIGSLGPLLPGSPDPIDQHMADLYKKPSPPDWKKPIMPQYPIPKPNIPPTQLPSPIEPPFIPSPTPTPYINPINTPVFNTTRQDLTPNPNQTVILRNKKKSVAPKRKLKKVVKKSKK